MEKKFQLLEEKLMLVSDGPITIMNWEGAAKRVVFGRKGGSYYAWADADNAEDATQVESVVQWAYAEELDKFEGKTKGGSATTMPDDFAVTYIPMCEKVMLVNADPITRDNYSEANKRVVFGVKDGFYLAWSNAETIEDAKTELDIVKWKHAVPVDLYEAPSDESEENGPVDLSVQEIADKFDLPLDKIRIKF